MKSLKYKVSPTPSGGLEVLLLLNLIAKKYGWFTGHLVEIDENKGENEVDFDTIDIIAEEDSSDESEQNLL